MFRIFPVSEPRPRVEPIWSLRQLPRIPHIPDGKDVGKATLLVIALYWR